MKSNIGISGSTGFVGKHLSEFLAINNVSFSSFGKSRNKLAKNNIYLDFPISKPKDLINSLKGIDTFIHLAARTPKTVDNYLNANEYWEINSLGTLELLNCCNLAKVKEFVHISAANLLSPQNGIATESSQYGKCTQSPYYLSSKIAAEIFLESFQSNSVKVKIIRPSSIYGPGRSSDVINTFINRLASNKQINIHGAGSWSSDLIYVSDISSAIYSSLFADYTGVLNIGSGELTSIKELAIKLCEILQAPTSLIKYDLDFTEKDSFPQINIEKAKKLLNFKPTSLNNGLKKMCQYIKKI